MLALGGTPVERIPHDEHRRYRREQQRSRDEHDGTGSVGSCRGGVVPSAARLCGGSREGPRSVPGARCPREARGHLELQRVQLVEHVARGLVPIVRVLFEAAPDHAGQVARQIGPDLGRGQRIVLEQGREQLDGVRALKWSSSGGHLVEHHAEGEDVGTRIHVPAAGLLGRHVVRRADDHTLARGGHRLRTGEVRLVARGAHQLGQAEVEDFDPLALVGDHHVARLQVAVDDPLGMGAGDRVGDGDGQFKDAPKRKARCRQQLVEGFPLDQLHGQKVDAVRFVDRVQGDDVGMVQPGDGLGLAREPGQPIGVRGHLLGQHLQRHVAPQLGVLGAIDVPHAARTELGGDPVVGEFAVDHGPRQARATGFFGRTGSWPSIASGRLREPVD